MRSTALILALFCLPMVGCGGASDADTTALQPEDYGTLPGLAGSTSPKLRDELARIVEEGGTPELLSQTSVADGENVAAGLRDLFPEKKVVSILVESENIFPPGRFPPSPMRLQRAIGFREKYDAERLRAREALKRPQCDFGIRFTVGFMADVRFIDVVRICGRLEAFRAAEALADDKPNEAIESLELMLRLASCLAAEKHGQARAQAAFARTEAFVVLQAVLQHEKTARRQVESLYQTVESQLKAWPSDAEALIGDRALGMHAYEMVRTGELVALLTNEEIEGFSKEAGPEQFVAAIQRNVDRDELYYLETMRQIIDACRQRYYTRLELFNEIHDDLEAKANLPEFPTVAARILMPDIEKLQVMQAQDRANWEACAVALAAAIGRQPLPYQVSPLTGKKYSCKRDGNYIVVGNFGTGLGDDLPMIYVPYLGD